VEALGEQGVSKRGSTASAESLDPRFFKDLDERCQSHTSSQQKQQKQQQ